MSYLPAYINSIVCYSEMCGVIRVVACEQEEKGSEVKWQLNQEANDGVREMIPSLCDVSCKLKNPFFPKLLLVMVFIPVIESEAGQLAKVSF